MKYLVLLIFTVVILSCHNQSDESFSTDFFLDHTTWLSLPFNDSMAVPYWDSEDSFWTAFDYDSKSLTQMDLEGNVLDEITLYVYPDAPSIVSDPFVSKDGGTLVFTGGAENAFSRDVYRINLDSEDHRMFTLDGVENVRLPNLEDLLITSPDYPWDDKMGYLGTKLDYNAMTGIQSYYIYDFETKNTQSFSLGSYDLDKDGNPGRGDYYYNPTVYADPEDPDNVDMIMFCVRLERAGDAVYTVKMFDSSGTVQYDGSEDYQFENIGGIRWLDDQSLLMAVQQEGVWKIISADESARIQEFYKADSHVYSLQGLSLSPSKNKCLTQIKYGDFDQRSEILIVKLY